MVYFFVWPMSNLIIGGIHHFWGALRSSNFIYSHFFFRELDLEKIALPPTVYKHMLICAWTTQNSHLTEVTSVGARQSRQYIGVMTFPTDTNHLKMTLRDIHHSLMYPCRKY